MPTRPAMMKSMRVRRARSGSTTTGKRPALPGVAKASAASSSARARLGQLRGRRRWTGATVGVADTISEPAPGWLAWPGAGTAVGSTAMACHFLLRARWTLRATGVPSATVARPPAGRQRARSPEPACRSRSRSRRRTSRAGHRPAAAARTAAMDVAHEVDGDGHDGSRQQQPDQAELADQHDTRDHDRGVTVNRRSMIRLPSRLPPTKRATR